MKKYAFPFTLGLVCFVGGYFSCIGNLTIAQQARDAQREQQEKMIWADNLRLARQAATNLQGTRIEFGLGSRAPKPELGGWRSGLIAPMIPPKVVAP